VTRRVEGILLAAGESRRMGYPKPLLKIGGRTFIEHITATMLEAVPRLVIVLGAYADRVRAVIKEDPRIIVVENPDCARGQLSSLRIGLGNVSKTVNGALVHLSDHPQVGAATFKAIVAEYERAHKPVVIARYRGRRGHPVVFDRSLFAELMAVPENQGARAVVDADPSRVDYLDVNDPGIVLDLDSPADLEKAGFEPPPANQ
jgi:molybdenum cofactor cytidylyltransferase